MKEWTLKHQDQVKLHRKQEYLNKKDRLKNEYKFKKVKYIIINFIKIYKNF